MKNYEDGPLVKVIGGFTKDCDLMTLEWDSSGKYRGQWQEDMLDGAGRIFIGPDPSGRCFVADLTPEQMASAQS